MSDSEEVAEDAPPALCEEDRARVVEAIAEVALQLLRVSIDQGGDGCQDTRNALFHLLHHWPVLCKSARDAIACQTSYPPIVWYERVRVGHHRQECWFLDGLPTGMPMFGAPVAIEFPVERMRDLLYEDVVRERGHTILKLEGMPLGSKKRLDLAASLDKLPDISLQVPQTVRMFISRVRSMCHGLRAVRTSRSFAQCHNAQCNRLFFLGERGCDHSQHPIGLLNVAIGSRAYWSACAPMPEYATHRFCTRACEHQWANHHKRLVPDALVDYESEKLVRARDGARIGKALEAALERNRALCRVIQKRRRAQRRSHVALSRADLNRELEARIDMLNVDTGLLYAASIAARLPTIAQRRTLPGVREDWRRSGAETHRNALIRVARIYRQHRERAPVFDLLDPPAYFRALRADVLSIF